MNDQQREMRALAMFKSIWEGFSHSLADNPEMVWERVEEYAKKSIAFVDSYSKVAKLPITPQKTTVAPHLSDELVSKGVTKVTPYSNEDTRLNDVQKAVIGISFVSEKEYKPGKYRYGIKDVGGTWYSSFFKTHCEIAKKAKMTGKQAVIYYEVGEYNGKPQYTIQSIELAGSNYLKPDEVESVAEELAETAEVGD